MQDTTFAPTARPDAKPESPFPSASVGPAKADPGKPEPSRMETGLGAWASAISADDNAQAAIALAEAINRARNAQASRENRAADARIIAVSRLETLRAKLAPVYAAIPRDVELFDLGMVGHAPPRLFVDIIAFVEMAEDGKGFRLVQESRAGRVIIGEAADDRQMTALVTNYIAERLVERERALAAQGMHLRPAPLPKAVTPTAPRPSADIPPEATGTVDEKAANAETSASAIGPAASEPALPVISSAIVPAVAQAVTAPPKEAQPAATMRMATPSQAAIRHAPSRPASSGGWFWALLALLVGIGIGALALYLYAASLTSP
jgi:hypothetical protein